MSGVTKDLIRVSVGIEHIDDIIEDFEHAFEASGAAITGGDLRGQTLVPESAKGDALPEF